VKLPNVTSPREAALLLQQYGLSPRRSRGQNFLVDANVARKIVAAADTGPGEGVVEVGPGLGALTLMLASRQARVVAVELDEGLCRLLKDLLADFSGVQILCRDALEVDWKDLRRDPFLSGCRQVKLVANLPYNISSVFMYSLYREGFPFDRAVLMFQKEVARRLVALPGESGYGGLSVLTRYYTRGELLFPVSRNVFWPRPRVDSAVVLLEPAPKRLSPGEEALLWKLVKELFQQRRKTVANGLIRWLGRPREEVESLLGEARIDPRRRPESLSLEEFALLSQLLYNCSVGS